MTMGNRGFWSWYLQRITALLLVMGIAVHFFTFHFSPGRYSARYYDEIVHRFCSPGWIAFHLCLLSLVVFHGLNGLWGIVMDFRISKKAAGLLKGGLWVTGIILFGAGLYVSILFARQNSGF